MAKEISKYKSIYPSKNIELLLKGKINFFSDVARSEEIFIRFNLGKRNLVLVNDAEAIKFIMIDQYKNFEKRTNLKVGLGSNIFTASGEEWAFYRRPVMPIFTNKNFNNIFQDTKEIIENFFTNDIKENELNNIDAVYFYSRLVFLLNNRTIIGKDFSKYFDTFNQDLYYMNFYFTQLNYRFVKSGILSKFLYKDEDNKFNHALNRIDSLILNAMDEKEDIKEHSVLARMMKLLNEENSKFSRTDVLNQIKMMIFAGYETTSLSLSWVTYMLGLNQEWQEILFEEHKSIDIQSIEDIHKVPNTKNVIYETLRLHPIGWALTRYAIKDIEYNGYKINADDCMFMSPYLIHRRSDYYTDPLKFNPSRFKNIDTSDLGTKYLAFGAGPRTCIGEDLAMFQLVLTIRNLVLNYKIVNRSKKVEENPQTTLMFKEPFYVELKKR